MGGALRTTLTSVTCTVVCMQAGEVGVGTWIILSCRVMMYAMAVYKYGGNAAANSGSYGAY